MYDKWPLSEMMQQIAAKLVVSKRLVVLKELPAQSASPFGALRETLRRLVFRRGSLNSSQTTPAEATAGATTAVPTSAPAAAESGSGSARSAAPVETT